MTREESEGILGDPAGTQPRLRCFLIFADSDKSLRMRLKYKAY